VNWLLAAAALKQLPRALIQAELYISTVEDNHSRNLGKKLNAYLGGDDFANHDYQQD
jgi:hypothetical protein